MHRRNRTPCTFLADKGEKKKVLAQPGREGAGGGGGERGEGVGEEGGRRATLYLSNLTTCDFPPGSPDSIHVSSFFLLHEGLALAGPLPGTPLCIAHPSSP